MYQVMLAPKSRSIVSEVYDYNKKSDPVWNDLFKRLRLMTDISALNVPVRKFWHDKKDRLGDVIYCRSTMVAVNQSFKNLLIAADIRAAYFPFVLVSEHDVELPYSFIGLSNKARVIDLHRSVFSRSDSSLRTINEVMSLAINESIDHGPIVHCIDCKLIFVKDSLVQRFKEEGITGVEFCPINEFSGRP